MDDGGRVRRTMNAGSMPAAAAIATNDWSPLDVDAVRRDFPILERRVYDRPLVYLDSAASAQKPRPVLEVMDRALCGYYSNVHRGVHRLSQEATAAFEAARAKTARFLNAASADEIVFVRGATEGINLVAATFGRRHLVAGDEIILSHLEHHANIVPWQLLRQEKGVVLKVVPVDDEGRIDLDAYRSMLSPRTRLIAVTHISNALGVVTPIESIIALAHDHGVPVLVDGCQAVPHTAVDVRALDADFYVFSGHKLYGPTGIGVLYGKAAILEDLPPYQGGGEMIATVTFDKTTFKKPPHRFEAGTPAIVEAIGLGAAIDYVTAIGLDRIAVHERALRVAAEERLQELRGLRLHGRVDNKAAIVSFTFADVHPHDVGTVLDRLGIAVRAGHHCAQPLMARLGVAATTRASFAMFNTMDDVDALVRGIETVRELFA
jgi:cysteine desulfurase/selenocysteine lyase